MLDDGLLSVVVISSFNHPLEMGAMEFSRSKIRCVSFVSSGLFGGDVRLYPVAFVLSLWFSFFETSSSVVEEKLSGWHHQ